MALSIMLILEIVIIFSFLVTSIFMFVPKNNPTVHKIFFALSIMLGILVTVIDATSLPSNYTPQIIIAWIGLVPSAIAVIISAVKGKPNTLAKFLTMVTTVFGVLGYLFLS